MNADTGSVVSAGRVTRLAGVVAATLLAAWLTVTAVPPPSAEAMSNWRFLCYAQTGDADACGPEP